MGNDVLDLLYVGEFDKFLEQEPKINKSRNSYLYAILTEKKFELFTDVISELNNQENSDNEDDLMVLDLLLHYYLQFSNNGLSIDPKELSSLSEIQSHLQGRSIKQIWLGLCYFLLGFEIKRKEPKSAIAYFKKAYDVFPSNDIYNKVRSNLELAKLFRETGKYEDSIELCDNTIEMTKLIKLSPLKGDLWNLKGDNLRVIQRNDQAKTAFQTALQIFEELDNDRGISASKNNLGICSWAMGQIDEAIKFHKEALEIRLKLGIPIDIAASYENLGIMHAINGNLETASSFLEDAYDILKEFDDLLRLSRILGNLATLNTEMGNYQKALKFFERSLEIKLKLHNKRDIGFLYSNMSVLYWLLGSNLKSLKSVEQAIDYLSELEDSLKTKIWINASLINAKCNQHESSLGYLDKARQYLEFQENKVEYSNDLFSIILANFELNIYPKNLIAKLQNMELKEDSPKYNLRNNYIQIKSKLLFHNDTDVLSLNNLVEELDSIINSQTSDFGIVISAIIDKLMVTLQLIETTKEYYRLNGIKNDLSTLIELANREKSYLIVVKTLIIQSKIELIENEIENAKSCIEDALIIIEDNHLINLKQICNNQLELITEMEKLWEEAAYNAISIEQRIISSKLKEFLKGENASWGLTPQF